MQPITYFFSGSDFKITFHSLEYKRGVCTNYLEIKVTQFGNAFANFITSTYVPIIYFNLNKIPNLNLNLLSFTKMFLSMTFKKCAIEFEINLYVP